MNGTVEDPLAWRSFADEDLLAARVLSEQGDAEALAHVIAFHAHQSAEKYLKGLLVLHERKEPPHIHALPDLLQKVIAYVPDLDGQEMRDVADQSERLLHPEPLPR